MYREDSKSVRGPMNKQRKYARSSRPQHDKVIEWRSPRCPRIQEIVLLLLREGRLESDDANDEPRCECDDGDEEPQDSP